MTDEARSTMVERTIAARGITGEAVLDAFRFVPREKFVSSEMVEFAYDDSALPIEEGQTISQPYVVAVMTEALEIGDGDRVLEIGTGSGYGAAILGRVAHEVWSIERHRPLAEKARARLEDLGYDNVHVVVGDGTLGWPDAAPFDAISVTAGGPNVPRHLTDQLVDGGRLVIPVGGQDREQRLVRLRRQGDDLIDEELGAVRFVPLIGEHGWVEGAEGHPGGR
ncbi:MAG: protein-L-isoaspartate(D-aspartate) O-methyltransferase [Acidimicrobiales bacterium]